MICANCLEDHNKEVEMSLESATTDYHEPANYLGHGQYTNLIWECPDCLSVEDYEVEEVEV